MSIDKKISYVEQDGSLNFIKNSKSVTVPKRFKARKNAPATKLAYITDAEASLVMKQIVIHLLMLLVIQRVKQHIMNTKQEQIKLEVELQLL